MDMMPTWADEAANGESDTPTRESDWMGAIPVSMIVDGVGYSLCPGMLAMPPEVGTEAEATVWTIMTTLPEVDVSSVTGQTATVPEMYLCGAITETGRLCLTIADAKPSEPGEDADGDGKPDIPADAAAGHAVPLDTTDSQASTAAHARAPLAIGAETDRPRYRPATARPIMYIRLDNWRQRHIWGAIVDGILYAWIDDSWFGTTNSEDYMIRDEIQGVPGSIYDPIDLPDPPDGVESAGSSGPTGSEDLDHVPICVIGDPGTGGPILPTPTLRLGSCWIGDMGLEGGSQIMTRQERTHKDEHGQTVTTSETVINESLPWVECFSLPMSWSSITWGREMTLTVYGVYHGGTYVFRVEET